MTGRTARVDRGRNHSYLLDGEKVPGVTTLIKQGVPAPALVGWAGKTVAQYAVDHWDELGDMPPTKRYEELKGAPWKDRDAAANKGTRVHALGEKLVAGEEVDVPEELAGHVEAYVNFLDTWDVQPVLVERPVFNRANRYGGSFDLIADLADGRRWLLDLKTNRSGPFGEVALQLAAYRFAETYLDTNGEEQPMPAVDACGVVWVRADGADLIPFHAGYAEFRAFQYAAQVAAFVERARDLKGDAITSPIKEIAA